ncbi:hypothetical protein ACFV0R_08200 [Streptomyces sp. NPDC059578]|uniref:hypothetical protein n=1 Tax=unclassified Streptomyces TaxID=2593676 RepID=UPI00364A10DB
MDAAAALTEDAAGRKTVNDSDELRGLVMPELYLPMPPHEPNPSYRQAYDAMREWVDSYELFTDAKAWEVGEGGWRTRKRSPIPGPVLSG